MRCSSRSHVNLYTGEYCVGNTHDLTCWQEITAKEREDILRESKNNKDTINKAHARDVNTALTPPSHIAGSKKHHRQFQART